MKRLTSFLLASSIVFCLGISCQPDSPVTPEDTPEEEEQTDDPEVPDAPQPEYEPGVKVQITLSDNLDTPSTKTINAVTGEVMGADPAWKPERKGYLFSGWYRDEDCTDFFNFEVDTVKTESTLYAGFVREVTLVDRGIAARVTGKSVSGETYLNPNNTSARYALGGTDLGIIWEMSDGRYGILFGDSFDASFAPCGGGPGAAGGWRSNTLAFNSNTTFSKGLVFDGMYTSASNKSYAIAVHQKTAHYSFTTIPTSAVCMGGVEYMHYMYWEVGSRQHDSEVYSSYCISRNAGQSWTDCSSRIKFGPNSFMGMVAMATKPGDEYCYILGTQTGAHYRTSAAILARVTSEHMLDKDEYEYWAGSKWKKGDENFAAKILEGPIGEAGLIYLERFKVWLYMYLDNNATRYRTAARPQGPWSEERVLCTGGYGSYVHPACGAEDYTSDLYWTTSYWNEYNVFLRQAGVQFASK